MAKKIAIFVYSVGICLLAGVIGSFYTTSAIGAWYKNLIKPPFNPPNWVFAPVWTLLFILMGVALFLIITADKKNRYRRNALAFFYIQLIANVLWSVLFFGLQSPLFALVEIIWLWFFILITVILFYRVSRPASYLLWPYILWVSFASILNFAIWHLNT